MANKHASLNALFTDIADAIREKIGDTASIIADDFPDVIRERLQAIPTVTLISFTIDGTSYQAEEGMTWLTWVGSEYNTIGYTCSDNNSFVVNNSSGMCIYDSEVPSSIVTGGDSIISGYSYVSGGL